MSLESKIFDFNQDHEIIFSYRMPENIRKIHDVNILFQLNNKSRDLAMISGEI